MTKSVETKTDNTQKRLSELKVGEVFKGADGVERILLELLPDGTAVTITKGFVYENCVSDGDSNNYAKSSLRKRLEGEALPKLEDAFGAENIVEFEIDLTSDDGLDTYGKIKTKYGLLTDAQYRKYSRIIANYPVNDWWWTATPYSTTERGWKSLVRVVSDAGIMYLSFCYYDRGVRAVCILKSNIFVSI